MAADPPPVAAFFRSTAFNGSEGFIQAQAAGLTRYQPWIVALDRAGELLPALAGRAITPWSRSQVAAIKLLGAPARPPAALRVLAPALVHAHFATDGLRALPIARGLGVPLVTSLRGYDVTVHPARMLASGRMSWMRYAASGRRLAREGDLFLAVCDALRHQAIARGFPANRTHTHYNGVDLSRFTPSPEAATPGLILHVGRLVEKKGTATLLHALARLRQTEPRARLVIVGDGPLSPRLRQLAGELGLGEHARFLGALPHDQTRDWMKRAWVIAVPSLRAGNGDAEGLPNVVVEAAATATPAVASIHSGIPEAVLDGQTGFLVPEGDVDALARRLGDVLGSPDLRARLAAGALALAKSRFDGAAQSRRLESIYDQLICCGAP